jgi:hypothetical protein
MKNEKRGDGLVCRFSFFILRFAFALAFPPVSAGFALLAADFAAAPWLGHTGLLSM